ncbi:MAG: DUF4112 domain-containing protein [Hyphomicrobium sp.]
MPSARAETRADARHTMDRADAFARARPSAGAAPNIVTDETVNQSIARLDGLARVMDSAVRIPGTDIRMGVDAVIGLVPVVGDAISAAISGYILWEARRLGASRWLIARMAANSTLDAVLGSVPIVGDVFDVAYKANMKNLLLLRRHVEKHGLRDGRTITVDYTSA